VLVEIGKAWMSFSDRLEAIVSDATSTATEVWTGHEGEGRRRVPGLVGQGGQPGQDASGRCERGHADRHRLMICGGIVLALKVAVIAQLAILAAEVAQAVATAVPTFRPHPYRGRLF
jgi:hypothetical protein